MNRLLRKFGLELRRLNSPQAVFHAPRYLRQNARVLEHLASLNLEVAGRTVLEVGAGIGDHTHFYIDRGCKVTITEARRENLAILAKSYSSHTVMALDLETPHAIPGAPFEVVHCYGLLYHLKSPDRALEFLSTQCSNLLLLETCVSFGNEILVNPVPEDRSNPSQAVSGIGCRPTRPWVFSQLRRHFQHVYVPRTQPNHEHFPLDWGASRQLTAAHQRGVFVGSRTPLQNPLLSDTLLDHQSRHA